MAFMGENIFKDSLLITLTQKRRCKRPREKNENIFEYQVLLIKSMTEFLYM